MWVQALSARLFGYHVWSLMLPQAVEGAITVLVLYHAVRRLAGPLAALTASVVLAASPSTMTLDRGNIPDSLMILLLVLAADSTVTAVLTGRRRSVVMVGVWVGLAFQAKMLEAWLVLPALGLAYLVAARGTTWARLGRVVVIGGVTVVVSLSYMTFVTLTPASQRPYVDGSTSNSVYQQVFDYNGFSRVGQASPNQVLGRTLGTPLFSQAEPPPAWNRLLTRSYGRDTGWLLPAAVIATAGILVARRRKPRTDLPRAGALLWGTWLLVLAVVFSISTTMNSYYAGALSPAMAGLLGIGSALAWEHPGEAWIAVVTAGTVLITVGYATWILPTRGTGLPNGLAAAAIALGVLAVVALAWSALHSRQRARPVPAAAVAVVLAGAALLLVPAVASASVVAEGLGPFDTPFQSTPDDDVHPRRILPAAVAPRPGVHRGGPPGRAVPHGGPDVGRGRALHLRDRRGGAPAGGVHRHHSRTAHRHHAGHDRRRGFPSGARRVAGCHPQHRVHRPALSARRAKSP